MNRSKRHILTPASQRKYSADSGLVFSEREVQFSRKQSVDWVKETKKSALVKKSQVNSNGARSLADMAIIKTATQFRDLTSDHFSTVPWKLADKVWQELLDKYASNHLFLTPSLTQ
jgi:hypothetical protein